MQEDCIFQQDYVAIYVSKLSKAWFDNRKTLIMEWPAHSSDLNSMRSSKEYLITMCISMKSSFIKWHPLNHQ